MSTNISLTPELEKYAKSKVEEGLYNSVSELMREALRMHRRAEAEHLQYMRAELAIAEAQIARGEIEPFDIEDIIAEAKAEYRIRNDR
ncbi:MAG: hypothetical protein FD163_1010 [Hyphomonadaceae bacterium]|nr:MAG: hypothetical protein FD128_1987 [Hyphomonadaceae bacterium]KAF0186342.1 MAG: hypothetical protein FD163_1010 [Hyphomonadaceae bacterium]